MKNAQIQTKKLKYRNLKKFFQLKRIKETGISLNSSSVDVKKPEPNVIHKTVKF